MSFKKMPSVHKTYNEQGAIYFAVHNYYKQSKDVQLKIDMLCVKVGKYNYKALFRLLTTDEPLNRIARECYVSPRHLSRLRNDFFNAWKW